MTILWAHVSTHRGDVIYLEDGRPVIDLLDHGLKSRVLVAPRIFGGEIALMTEKEIFSSLPF